MNWNSPNFWVDGGCHGNHLPAEQRRAYGSISDGVDAQHFDLPKAKSNNEAEFMSLNFLLSLLPGVIDPSKGPLVHMDSKIVVNSLTKGWKIKADNLIPLHWASKALLHLTGAKLKWVPRDRIEAKVGH
jgi:ribonuclease HI